jgi:hypothetical protein
MDNVNQNDIEIKVKPFDEIEKKEESDNKDIKIATSQIDKTDTDLNVKPPKFKVPPSLWKTFVCSLSLFALGATLIGIGFINSVANADPGKGITFWTIGSIVFIPGAFYSYKFWKAKRSRSEEARQEIYDQIPEM